MSRRWAGVAATLVAVAAVGGCAGWQQPADTKAPLPMADYGPPTGKYESDEPPDDDPLTALSPSKLVADLKESVGIGPDERVARAEFEQAEKLFRQAQYEEAAQRYRTAARRWPDSPLEEEALFMAGEAFFFADRYVQADDAYSELVKEHSGTPHLDKVTARRFAIARYWQQVHHQDPHWPVTPNFSDPTRPVFDTAGHALRIYGKLPVDDPTSPLADDAVMATANTYFALGRYRDADHYYTMLRNEYPKSEHQFQAHLLGLRAKLLTYQGPDYEGQPLNDAELVVNQLLTQFSRELDTRNERERVMQARAQIQFQKAQREWNLAEYYRRLEYHEAARMHYETIITRFPNTEMATASRAQIEALRGLPGEPNRWYQPLVDVFPESAKEGPSIAAEPGPIRR